MYCTKCGKEIFDEAVICPHCGSAVSGFTQTPTQNASAPNGVFATGEPENGGMATAALICAFLVPVVGLILGIIGLTKYKTESLKNKCIAAIPISIFVWIACTVGWLLILNNI